MKQIMTLFILASSLLLPLEAYAPFRRVIKRKQIKKEERNKKYYFQSNDGEVFHVGPSHPLLEVEFLKPIIDQIKAGPQGTKNNPVKLDLPAWDLGEVNKFLLYHQNHPPKKIKIPFLHTLYESGVYPWDIDFIEQNKNLDDISRLANAGLYLQIPDLTDLALLKLATLIKGKTKSEIREFYGINQYFPEDERKRVAEDS